MPSTECSTAPSTARSFMTIPFQMRNAVLTRSGTLRYLAFTSCHRNSTSGAGQPFAMADNVALGSRAWNRSGLSEYVSRALARGANHAPAGAPDRPQAVEPGGVQQYMAHHGRAVTRVLDLPAAVINVYLEVDIALWPASSPFGRLYVVGPAVGHMGCARPAVDLGVVEDHAWAGTVRSARNPALSGQTAFFSVLERIRVFSGQWRSVASGQWSVASGVQWSVVSGFQWPVASWWELSLSVASGQWSVASRWELWRSLAFGGRWRSVVGGPSVGVVAFGGVRWSANVVGRDGHRQPQEA